jgi:hypothetical protein
MADHDFSENPYPLFGIIFEGARMRAAIGLLLSAVLVGPASAQAAYDPNDPNNCVGIDWDDKRVVVVSKVTAHLRVNFIKSPYDDDFTATTCPATTAACRKQSYLETGDFVLVDRTQGDFACVMYKSPLVKKPITTTGWLPTAALMPVAPMRSPRASDWIGTWDRPGGGVEIKNGAGGKLHIEADMTLPAGRELRNGYFKAQIAPKYDTIVFDDGYDDGCRVRMQRVGPWLMVEDNRGCGGYGVSFTGLYRRTK